MSGDDGEILGIAADTVWERNSNDGSILPETQRHELRAGAAQPEGIPPCSGGWQKSWRKGSIRGRLPAEKVFLLGDCGTMRNMTGWHTSPPYRAHHPFHAYILLRGGRGSSDLRYPSV